MARMVRAIRVGIVGLLVTAGACATSGTGSGVGQGPGDSGGGQVDGGHDSGGSTSDSSTADAGSGDTQGMSESGPTETGGGGQPDSGPCSLTSMSLCGNGAECCFLDGGAVCECQTGTGTQGSTCSSTMGCAQGFVCGLPNGMTTGSCLEWCALPSGTCGAGTTCMSLFTPVPMVNGVSYGACK
jgi:hypothetical protein